MSRDMDLLDQEFHELCTEVDEACLMRGIEMRTFFTLRTPEEQARLWRQSRPSTEINSRIQRLRDVGANYLADCIQNVGPQYGGHVTNAIPGLSWHQYGLARDTFWIWKGKAIWRPDIKKVISGVSLNGYHVLHEEAEKAGLTTISFKGGGKDWPHIQMPKEGSPRKLYSWSDIDYIMKSKFG